MYKIKECYYQSGVVHNLAEIAPDLECKGEGGSSPASVVMGSYGPTPKPAQVQTPCEMSAALDNLEGFIQL